MHSARLVIGYGNRLRADDGFGCVVAERLSTALHEDSLTGDVVVLAEHQLTPELSEPISRAQLVIFIDAREGDQPGRIDSHAVTPHGEGSLAFSHEVDPSSLVQMARLLYRRCPAAIAVSVDGEDFGFGTALSPVVQAAVPEVVRHVRDVLANRPAAVRPSVETGFCRTSLGG